MATMWALLPCKRQSPIHIQENIQYPLELRRAVNIQEIPHLRYAASGMTWEVSAAHQSFPAESPEGPKGTLRRLSVQITLSP